MTRTTMYLPAELQRELRDASRRTGRPQAELVRSAIEDFLRRQRRPLPRSIGVAADGTLHARESEAWLRETWGRR